MALHSKRVAFRDGNGMERKNDMHGRCPFGNIIPGNDSISDTDILAPTLMVDCCAFGVISGSR